MVAETGELDDEFALLPVRKLADIGVFGGALALAGDGSNVDVVEGDVA